MVRDKFPEWELKIQFWEIKDLGEGDLAHDPISLLETAVEDLVEQLVARLSTANT
jgi:hypothetical protein